MFIFLGHFKTFVLNVRFLFKTRFSAWQTNPFSDAQLTAFNSSVYNQSALFDHVKENFGLDEVHYIYTSHIPQYLRADPPIPPLIEQWV